MKTKNYGIGWILLDVAMVIILIADLWTGKLAMDQWLKIALASIMGGILFVVIMKNRIKKEREKAGASK